MSVVILCYNESALLREVVERTCAALAAGAGTHEVLVIDDGSRDGSAELADRLAQAHAAVRVHHHPGNLGIGAGLRSAYRLARGAAVWVIPADLQFAPEDILSALAALADADVVNVCRAARRDPWGRKLVSMVDRGLVRLLFGRSVRDLHWVKVYRRGVLEAVTAASRSPMVDTELLVRARRAGFRIVELSLPHHPRTAGQARGASLRNIAATLRDLLALRMALWREPRPVARRSGAPGAPTGARRGGPRGRRRLLFAALTALGVLMTGELLVRAAYRLWLPRYEAVRMVLAGEPFALPLFQNSVSQPYLHYVPAPNYRTRAGLEHNAAGFRGRDVPLARTPGVARVLCLGGSTTYGWGVKRAADAYPAQLERILADRLPAGLRGVEVINAGLPFGTTAEILTHYHFKFHYYRPDVVVIDAGGNDAAPLCADFYHPDYSHWRTTLRNPEPLPPQSRWLMRSRLASLPIIFLFYDAAVNGQHLTRPAGVPPLARWYPTPPRSRADQPLDIPADGLAFRHNLDAAIAEMQRDGATVILIAFRPAPRNHYPADLRAAMARNESEMARAAEVHGLTFLPFPATAVPVDAWVDDCHLDPRGEHDKAAYVSGAVSTALASESVADVAAAGAGVDP
ncbi:MAG: glycosyltransferase [Phycisphaerae bacterium]